MKFVNDIADSEVDNFPFNNYFKYIYFKNNIKTF